MIPRYLQDPKLRCPFSPLPPIQSQMNPVCFVTLCFFKIRFVTPPPLFRLRPRIANAPHVSHCLTFHFLIHLMCIVMVSCSLQILSSRFRWILRLANARTAGGILLILHIWDVSIIVRSPVNMNILAPKLGALQMDSIDQNRDFSAAIVTTFIKFK